MQAHFPTRVHRLSLSILPLSIVAISLIAGPVQAEVILQYGTGPSVDRRLDPVVEHASISAQPLRAGGGLTSANLSVFRFTRWNPSSTSFEAGNNAGDDFRWSFTIDQPNAIVDLTSFDLGIDTTIEGPDDFELRARVNGGTAISLLSQDLNGAIVQQNYLDVDASALSGLTTGDTISFQLVAFNSDTVFGGFSLEEITNGGANSFVLNGDVTIVPEPGTALLLGLGLCGIARRPRSKNEPR